MANIKNIEELDKAIEDMDFSKVKDIIDKYFDTFEGYVNEFLEGAAKVNGDNIKMAQFIDEDGEWDAVGQALFTSVGADKIAKDVDGFDDLDWEVRAAISHGMMRFVGDTDVETATCVAVAYAMARVAENGGAGDEHTTDDEPIEFPLTKGELTLMHDAMAMCMNECEELVSEAYRKPVRKIIERIEDALHV